METQLVRERSWGKAAGGREGLGKLSRTTSRAPRGPADAQPRLPPTGPG